jgi:hypothetical protein
MLERPCVRCHENEAKPGRTTCTWCTEYRVLNALGVRDARKARGLCARCGVNRVTVFVECTGCRLHHARLRTTRRLSRGQGVRGVNV